MKKYVGIGLTLLFFLLLLVLLLVKILGGTSEVQNDSKTSGVVFPEASPSAPTISNDESPDAIAQQCVSWYLKYYVSVPEMSFERLSQEPTIQRCFSPSFIKSWKEILAVSETDPVLLSSDYEYSWTESVRTRVVSQLSQSSSVEILLGTGSQTHILVARLEQSDLGGRITSISAAVEEEQP